jgi:hypothetical protein
MPMWRAQDLSLEVHMSFASERVGLISFPRFTRQEAKADSDAFILQLAGQLAEDTSAAMEVRGECLRRNHLKTSWRLG